MIPLLQQLMFLVVGNIIPLLGQVCFRYMFPLERNIFSATQKNSPTRK